MHGRGRRILLAAVATSFITIQADTVHAQDGSRPARASAPAPAPATGRRIGTISIPRLKVVQPIINGVSDAVFDRGVGHWPGTPLPGEAGNMVLGGHRTGGMRPFYDIQKLVAGDRILVTRAGRTYTYVVTRSRIVKPTATWILRQTEASTLTLFTCHPRGSIRQRFIVTAALKP